MAEFVQGNWILLVIALLVALLLAWWILRATRRTKVEVERRDGEGSAPVRRNQALIDAPPAAPRNVPSPAPGGIAGVEEAVAATVPLAPPPPKETETPAASAPTASTPAPTAASAPEPAPLAEPASPATPAAPPVAGSDELLRIKGLGPRIAEQLRALGITSLDQIAAWDDAEIDRVDAQLGRFQGRIRRDNWPEQARLLTAEDISAYEERFGKL